MNKDTDNTVGLRNYIMAEQAKLINEKLRMETETAICTPEAVEMMNMFITKWKFKYDKYDVMNENIYMKRGDQRAVIFYNGGFEEIK